MQLAYGVTMNIKVTKHESALVIDMRDGSMHVKTDEEMRREVPNLKGVVAHAHLLQDAVGNDIEFKQIANWRIYHNVWVATAYNSENLVRAIGRNQSEAILGLEKLCQK
jgi:hypothetical protein